MKNWRRNGNFARGAEKAKHQASRARPCALGARKGQALSEYTLLTVVLTCGSLYAGFSFFPRFINAFQQYFDSFYLLINLPIP
jgi:hypothetical protein